MTHRVSDRQRYDFWPYQRHGCSSGRSRSILRHASDKRAKYHDGKGRKGKIVISNEEKNLSYMRQFSEGSPRGRRRRSKELCKQDISELCELRVSAVKSSFLLRRGSARASAALVHFDLLLLLLARTIRFSFKVAREGFALGSFLRDPG